LRHLGDNVLVFRGKHTSRICESEVQYDIDETQDEIAIVAADIDDDTTKHSEEDSDLGNGIKLVNGGSKIMIWVVSSI
jgi:hypothetical protein